MAGERCYLCNEEGSTEYPLVQCGYDEGGETCDRWCCRLHRVAFDETDMCLHHQGQMLLLCVTTHLATVNAKIADPPVMTSFSDVTDELEVIYVILKCLGDHLTQYNDAVNRGIRDGRLYA